MKLLKKKVLFCSVICGLSMSSVASQEGSVDNLDKKINNQVIHHNSMKLIERVEVKPVLPDILNPDINVDDENNPTIQVAIILDTSGSMNGLIDQARLKIWDIINEISKANKHNKNIRLEVALYKYGTSAGTEDNGYVVRLNNLTTDLDILSESLFNLRTSGSEEYAGVAINRAIDDLSWSESREDLKLIIIAGNEKFRQGNVAYEYSIFKAREENIIVNTIFCGDKETGIELEWKRAADKANGKYLSIDHKKKLNIKNTPYDDEINNLGFELNKTYVKYGDLGGEKKNRQEVQDTKAMSESSSYMAARNIAKSSVAYDTSDWDLVDKYNEDGLSSVDKFKSESVELKNMTKENAIIYLKQKSDKRFEIKEKIKELEKKRVDYLSNIEDEEDDFGKVFLDTVKDQAKEKGFKFN